MRYHWPGNVRELENVIERAPTLGSGDDLDFSHLDRDAEKSASEPRAGDRPVRTLDQVTAEHIRHVLSLTQGKVHGTGGAAELLAVHPSTLRHRMDRLGIEYGRSSGGTGPPKP